MSFLRDFPGADTYDGDLGFLIKQYYELLQKYEALKKDVDELVKLYDDVPQRIQDAIDKAIDEINQRFEYFQTTFEYYEKEFAEMRNEIAQLQGMYATFTVTLRQYVDNKDAETKAYCKALIDQWPTKLPFVKDPSDGFLEPVQTVLYHMYNRLGLGMPVWLFDSLHLTESDLVNSRMTVAQFDRYGLLFYWMWQYLRFTSPISGEVKWIKDIVYELAALHKPGVTVAEFDAAEITVEEFDKYTVTVYEHDWERDWFNDLVAGKEGG